MKKPVVFMFSGQGSQFYQMGKDFYETNPVFKKTLDECDAFVQSYGGPALVQEIYGRPAKDQFDDLLVTHPALVAIQYATYCMLADQGLHPDEVWGTSLGELVSSAVAGVISIETALLTAISHSRLVNQHCAAGGMIAVIADKSVLNGYQAYLPNITFVGDNFAEHFTVSGPKADLDRLETALKADKVNLVRLPVQFAFHSPFITSAKAEFLAYTAQQQWQKKGVMPIISTMRAGFVEEFSNQYFWEVVEGQMRFQDTVQYLEKQGARIYVDLGPAGTSATFVKYNLAAGSSSEQYPIITPFGRGERCLAAVKEAFANNR